jgi:hypothetical protein
MGWWFARPPDNHLSMFVGVLSAEENTPHQTNVDASHYPHKPSGRA